MVAGALLWGHLSRMDTQGKLTVCVSLFSGLKQEGIVTPKVSQIVRLKALVITAVVLGLGELFVEEVLIGLGGFCLSQVRVFQDCFVNQR